MDAIKRFAVKNKITYSIILFLYRIYIMVLSLLYYVMRIFPVNKKKIVVTSAKGKRYGDNPMYITNHLLGKGFDIVWLLNEDVDEEIPAEVRRVKYGFWNNLYELSTAGVWLDSNMKNAGFRKRKSQLYVQTWHGSYGLKKIGGDLEDKLPAIDKIFYQYNSKQIDVIVSNSKRTTEIYRRAFWYDGDVLEVGSPRNDVFCEDDGKYRDKVYQYFHLEKDKKIALYAPTYRNDYRIDSFKLDYESLRNNLSKRFGGEWVILIRLHPANLRDAKSFIQYNDNIINASTYSVMQELLVVSDVLITDYSSCMFDFAMTRKPCFLYATDVEQYKNEHDNYYELSDLPFPVATNDGELSDVVTSFDSNQYDKDLTDLFELVGLCESGNASEQVADFICEWIKGENA